MQTAMGMGCMLIPTDGSRAPLHAARTFPSTLSLASLCANYRRLRDVSSCSENGTPFSVGIAFPLS